MSSIFQRTRFRDMFRTRDPYKDIFAKQEIPVSEEPDVNTVTPPKPTKPDFKKMIMDEYSRPSSATARYDEYLSNLPDESEYQPSKKRRLMAALVGFGMGMANNPEDAFTASEHILNSPYQSALKHWERRRIPLANAAASESKDRAARIAMLKDVMTAEGLEESRASTAAAREATAQHQRNLELQAVENAKALERERLRQNASRAEQAMDRAADNYRDTQRDAATERYRNSMVGIARDRTGIARDRAASYATSIKNREAYTKHLIDKLPTLRGDSPAAQETAAELALHNVLNAPGNAQIYADYYHEDDKGKYRIAKPDKSMFDDEESFAIKLNEYAAFHRKLEEEKARILKANHPGANVPPKKTSGLVIKRRDPVVAPR